MRVVWDGGGGRDVVWGERRVWAPPPPPVLATDMLGGHTHRYIHYGSSDAGAAVAAAAARCTAFRPIDTPAARKRRPGPSGRARRVRHYRWRRRRRTHTGIRPDDYDGGGHTHSRAAPSKTAAVRRGPRVLTTIHDAAAAIPSAVRRVRAHLQNNRVPCACAIYAHTRTS